MPCTVTSEGEVIVAAGRGDKQNQCAHDDLRAGGYRAGRRRSGSRFISLMKWTMKPEACMWSALALERATQLVFGSRNQAKDHRLRTLQRSCAPDPTSHAAPPPSPGERCWGGQIRWAPISSKPVRGRIRCGWQMGGVSVSQIYCAPFPCIGQPASCRPSPKI